MKHNTIPSFLWQIIKPYKWYYVLMMQAPIIGAFYNVANMYSLKLVVDAFGKSEIPQYSDLLYPIGLYIGSILFFGISMENKSVFMDEIPTFCKDRYYIKSI